jgi:hypothetical protein
LGIVIVLPVAALLTRDWNDPHAAFVAAGAETLAAATSATEATARII